MTYVVTEACVKCKYTDCVDVCPVDCFREGPNFLVIDPDECIDCTLCVAECPVEAIYAEDDVPADQQVYIQLNADLAKHPNWTPIVESKDPLPDHEQWATVKGKLGELDRNVDPASTMQVANALIKANKDFDLIVFPGGGHGACESPYGQRRRADFFVRHMMGVEPRAK